MRSDYLNFNSSKGGSFKAKVLNVKEAKTLTEEDSGAIVFCAAGADNVVITLPTINKPDSVGMEFTFVNINADGGSTCRLTPDSGGKIIGRVVQHEGGNADATTADGLTTALDGADGKYVQLTKATGHQGDWIKIVCQGADWFVVGGSGTYAHEA